MLASDVVLPLRERKHRSVIFQIDWGCMPGAVRASVIAQEFAVVSACSTDCDAFIEHQQGNEVLIVCQLRECE